MEVVWSDLAIESLYDILSYIQGFFGKKLQIILLLTFVSIWRIRCIFYKQDHIYYQIYEDRIEVIIIWDGRQDPCRLQNLLIDFLTKQ